MKSCPVRGALLTRLISMVLIGLLALSLTSCAKVPAEGTESAEPALESVTAAAPEPEAVPTPEPTPESEPEPEPEPEPEYIDLRGELKTLEEMESLTAEKPDAVYTFRFLFAGAETDSTATELDIHGVEAESAELVARYLRFLPELRYLDMCDCGLSNEDMAWLRDEFPQIDIVWMLHMDIWSLRTDTIAFSTQSSAQNPHKLTSEDIQVLRYCTDLRALDLGHHHITDVSVIGEMEELRVLILACNNITDVTPLANLKHLKYLEIFENREITDISPLAELDELLDLNMICLFSVHDFTPLADLKSIERLWVSWTYITKEEVELLRTALPDCVVFTDRQEETIAGIWRDHERFRAMRDMYENNYLNELFE